MTYTQYYGNVFYLNIKMTALHVDDQVFDRDHLAFDLKWRPAAKRSIIIFSGTRLMTNFRLANDRHNNRLCLSYIKPQFPLVFPVF